MIVVLRTDATKPQIDHAIERVQELGFEPRVITGAFRTIIALIGDDNAPGVEKLDAIPGVEHVHRILKPFKLASREFHRDDTIVPVGKVRIGGGHLAMIAGPCAVESLEGLDRIAGSRQEGRREHPARRRVQAANIAVRVSGHGRRRA